MGDKDKNVNRIAYLACCFKITRPTDPNQFRLIPQNESERRRREAAVAQEQMIQQELERATRLIKIWIYDDDSSTTRSRINSYVIPPDDNNRSPSITKLVDFDGKLVCADDCGGIRIIKRVITTTVLGEDNNNTTVPMSQHDYVYYQFRCTGYDCKISCIEPIKKGNILAVSIHSQDNITTGGLSNGIITEETTTQSSSKVIQIINTPARGVYLLDIEKGIVRAILDSHHLDIVTCICPLPDGCILTAGGKMDATVRVWESSILSKTTNYNDDNKQQTLELSSTDIPVFTNAKKLNYPGYVFDLKVLHDDNNSHLLKNDDARDSSSSNVVYAIAAARYNLINIVI